MKKLEYIKMERSLYGLARDYENLYKDYQAMKKQLLYYKTYKSTIQDLIYPNTDERGLGTSLPTESEEADFSDF